MYHPNIPTTSHVARACSCLGGNNPARERNLSPRSMMLSSSLKCDHVLRLPRTNPRRPAPSAAADVRLFRKSIPHPFPWQRSYVPHSLAQLQRSEQGANPVPDGTSGSGVLVGNNKPPGTEPSPHHATPPFPAARSVSAVSHLDNVVIRWCWFGRPVTFGPRWRAGGC